MEPKGEDKGVAMVEVEKLVSVVWLSEEEEVTAEGVDAGDVNVVFTGMFVNVGRVGCVDAVGPSLEDPTLSPEGAAGIIRVSVFPGIVK